MRILMLGDARTEHLERWVRHFRHRGDTVWVASVQAAPRVDVPLRPPPVPSGLAYPLLVPALRRALRRLSPDLLVAHYLPNYGLLAVLSGFRPHVIVAWGSDLLVLPERNRLQRFRTRLVASRGEAFLVDARMLVAPLVEHGAARARVHVCPFGVDDDVLACGERTGRPREGTPVLLSNRRHEAVYRVDLFLDALCQVTARGAAFRAVVANRGTLTAALKRRIAGADCADRVTWPGYLDRGAYIESLAGADVYVSAADSDSTSVSLLEAMAAGLAVVVPDIAGNREWVTDGDDGLLYRPGDAGALAEALFALVEDPARRARLGRNARARVAREGRWVDNIRRAEELFARLTGAE